MNKKVVIGLAGEMGSGKDTFCDYLKENYENVFVFRFSDALTDVLKIFFDSIKREDQQWISSQLRERFGEDILVKALVKKVQNIDNGLIILNGVRRPGDFQALQKIGGKLVYVTADIKTRWERVILRKEKADDDVSFEKFLELGNAEAESSISVIASRSDFRIKNNGSKELFYEEIKKIIDSLNV
jgi:dephospho-CoA kinase